MLRTLGGGCHVPIGACSSIHDGQLTLRGTVLTPTGSDRIEVLRTAGLDAAESLGESVAAELSRLGASRLLGGKK